MRKLHSQHHVVPYSQ